MSPLTATTLDLSAHAFTALVYVLLIALPVWALVHAVRSRKTARAEAAWEESMRPVYAARAAQRAREDAERAAVWDRAAMRVAKRGPSRTDVTGKRVPTRRATDRDGWVSPPEDAAWAAAAYAAARAGHRRRTTD